MAFTVVPTVMNAFGNGEICMDDLEKSSTFKSFASASHKAIIQWKRIQLMSTDFKSYPDKHMIIARFPEPYTLSSAKAGVIVVDRNSHQTRYFTLETSFGGCMIVEISGDNRMNTGITIADKEDLTEFASIVFTLAVKQEKSKSGCSEQSASGTEQHANSTGQPANKEVKKVNNTEQAGAGESVIAFNLNALIKEMSSRFPEWNGLFTVTPKADHVLVECHKGFEDKNTRQAIPCLWRRKTFIENCLIFKVKTIVFIDDVNNTFDVLKPKEVDVSTLP